MPFNHTTKELAHSSSPLLSGGEEWRFWPESKRLMLGHFFSGCFCLALAAQMALHCRHKSRLKTLAKNVKIFCNKGSEKVFGGGFFPDPS